MEKDRNNPTIYKTSGSLTAEKMEAVYLTVERYLESSKPYLLEGFSLWELARALDIPPDAINQSVKHTARLNFREYISRMRVEEAKALLREAALTDRRVSIDAIGVRCGFSSHATFYKRFIGYESITPKAYMNQFLEKQ